MQDSPNEMVTFEQDGKVGLLTMQNPPYNLVSYDFLRQILEGVEQAVESGCRAVLLRSSLRNFSAGADLALFQMRDANSDKPAAGPSPRDFLTAMETAPIPIVCAIHGVCLGGGLEIALSCDYIIAARSSRLGSVEATLGLHPVMGGVQRQVARAGVARAKEMSMLARRYDAETLERWNLINLVVDDENLAESSLAVARELANGPTVAHRATKLLARYADGHGTQAADAEMTKFQEPIWTSKDIKIGLDSFAKAGPGMAPFKGE